LDSWLAVMGEPESVSDRIGNIISEDSGEFLTEFVVLANCVDNDGDNTFYYLTPEGQRMSNTLGLLESTAAVVKSWIVEGYSIHQEGMENDE